VTLDEFRALLASVASERLHRAIRRSSLQAARLGQGRARELARTRLRVRTGYLRRSIVGSVEDDTEGLETTIHWRAGSDKGARPVRYAALQEYGGTVRPKRGRYLAWPWPGGPAETPAGVPRYHSPRDVPGLRFVLTNHGNGLLVKDAGRGQTARTEIWYILSRKVTIPEHRYMRDAVQPTIEDFKLNLAKRLVALVARRGQ